MDRGKYVALLLFMCLSTLTFATVSGDAQMSGSSTMYTKVTGELKELHVKQQYQTY